MTQAQENNQNIPFDTYHFQIGDIVEVEGKNYEVKQVSGEGDERKLLIEMQVKSGEEVPPLREVDECFVDELISKAEKSEADAEVEKELGVKKPKKPLSPEKQAKKDLLERAKEGRKLERAEKKAINMAAKGNKTSTPKFTKENFTMPDWKEGDMIYYNRSSLKNNLPMPLIKMNDKIATVKVEGRKCTYYIWDIVGYNLENPHLKKII